MRMGLLGVVCMCIDMIGVCMRIDMIGVCMCIDMMTCMQMYTNV